MNEKTSVQEIEIEIRVKGDIREAVAAEVIFAVMGAVIFAVFWGLWYEIVGHVPKFLGFSRFWLDTISGAFYVSVVVTYVGTFLERYDELALPPGYTLSFRECVTQFPRLVLVGAFLLVDFIASIFFSFAAGLAAIIVAALIFWLCSFGVWFVKHAPVD